MRLKRLFTRLIYGFILLLFFGLPGTEHHALQPARAAALPEEQPGLMFVPNQGQFDPSVYYQVRGANATAWLVKDGVWFTLLEPVEPRQPTSKKTTLASQPNPRRAVNLGLQFTNSSPAVRLEALSPNPGQVSYLVGQPKSWKTGLPSFSGVRFRNLYPGINLVITNSSGGSGLNWYFEASPQADLSLIRLQVRGATRLETSSNSLQFSTGIGRFTLPLPGLVLPGESSTNMGKSTPGIRRVGEQSFEVTRPFVAKKETVQSESMDAATGLLFSTFLGGSNWENGHGIAVDINGEVFVTGETPSTDFPVTPGAFDVSANQVDAFVVKLNTTGTSLVYATFLGGNSQDTAWDIAVESGVAYLTGETWSSDFPVTWGTFDAESDVFVTAVNASGSGLVFSTLVSGGDFDVGYSISVEGGLSYVTGNTWSRDFPASGYNGNGDAFVTKLSSTGSVLYCVMFGGRDEDAGFAITASGGNAFVAGQTWSSNFPAPGYQGDDDVFALKLNSVGAATYSKLIGGTLEDSPSGIAVDQNGNAYLSGTTSSTNFPVTEGVYGGGSYDAFVTKLDSSGARVYATYLGGSGWDEGLGIGLDGLLGFYVTGETNSSNFPTTPGALQASLAGSYDAFITRYDLAGSDPGHRTYSSYFGGSNFDVANDIAVDEVSNSYLTGYTKSSNFPSTTGAYDTVLNGVQDVFVSKLLVGPAPSLSLQKFTNGADADLPPGPSLLVGSSVTWTYEIKNTGELSLSSVSLSDNVLGTITCPKTTLAPGEVMACSKSGTALLGQYANQGTASGTPSVGSPVTANDSSHYFGANPSISIIKRTNGQDANTAPGPSILVGNPVNWEYEVTNTGNIDLGNILVTDSDPLLGITCPSETLAPATSMICTASGTATAGQYTNTGYVTADPPDGLPAVQDSDPSNYFGAQATINLEKSVSPDGGSSWLDADSAPGPDILSTTSPKFKFVLTNTGNVTLSGLTLTDSDFSTTSCSLPTSLAPQATYECILTSTWTTAQHSNTAQASGQFTDSQGAVATPSDSDLAHYFGAAPGLNLVKTASPTKYSGAGQVINYSYQVQNSGNVTLSGPFTVSDDRTSNESCPVTASLSPGGMITCSSSYTILQADLASGSVTNQATASATFNSSPVTSNMDSETVTAIYPAISLVKTTNGDDADQAPGSYILEGQTVTWEYQVTNSGDVPLTTITVTDDQGVTPGYLSGDQNTNNQLDPGETWIYRATGTAVPGQYTNTGTVTALDPVSALIQTSDLSHYFGIVNRQISLVTGWNLITLLIEPVTPYKAQSMLDTINSQGGACTEIYRWVSGGWDIYIGGSGGNNFDILLGRGYFIRCSGSSTWNLQGKMFISGISINLLSGWNLIGIPYPPGFYNAQTLLTALNNQGGACAEVYRWQSGGWDLYIGGSGGTPFAIEAHRGYFVRCTTSSSFSP